MAEWLKVPVLKTGVPFSGTVGSNPTLSAKETKSMPRRFLKNFLKYRYSWVFLAVVIVAGAFLIGYFAGGSTTYKPDEITDITEEELEWLDQGLLIADGWYRVGVDIEPGIYRTTGLNTSVYGCRWQRLSGFQGETNNIIVQYWDDLGKPTIVKIATTDKGFSTQGCGKWYKASIPVNDDAQEFSDGAYLVGADIEPGLYRSEAQWGCQWERLSGVTRNFYSGRLFGKDSELIAAGRTTLVEITPTDKAFISFNCIKWVKEINS